MTVNVEELRAIVPVLEGLERDNRFFMESWAAGVVNPYAASYTECKTQFCMAGAKAVADGLRPAYDVMPYRTPDGRIVERAVANGMFVTPENRHARKYEIQRAIDPAVYARDEFGLTLAQANFLFDAGHLTRVSDLVRRIEHVIARDADGDTSPSRSWPQERIEEEYLHAEEDGERRQAQLAAQTPGDVAWNVLHGEVSRDVIDEPLVIDTEA